MIHKANCFHLALRSPSGMEAAMDKGNCTTWEPTAQEVGLTDHMQAPQGAASRQKIWKKRESLVHFLR